MSLCGGAGGLWYSSTHPYPRHSRKVCAVINLPRSSTVTEEPPVTQRRFARFWGGKSVDPRAIRTPISQSFGAWLLLQSISNSVLLTAGHARCMQGI